MQSIHSPTLSPAAIATGIIVSAQQAKNIIECNSFIGSSRLQTDRCGSFAQPRSLTRRQSGTEEFWGCHRYIQKAARMVRDLRMAGDLKRRAPVRSVASAAFCRSVTHRWLTACVWNAARTPVLLVSSSPRKARLTNERARLERTIRSAIGDDRYHVVLLLSGGKDSAYLLWRMRAEYPELRILCVTINNGFIMSQVGVG